MSLTTETKLAIIEARREAPEAAAYAAKLDADLARASENQAAEAEANKRLADANAQLTALSKASDELNGPSPQSAAE